MTKKKAAPKPADGLHSVNARLNDVQFEALQKLTERLNIDLPHGARVSLGSAASSAVVEMLKKEGLL